MRTRVVIAGSGAQARAAIARALTAAGFFVAAECADARAAVEAVATERPDVCVIDADLPGGALVAAATISRPPVPPPVLVLDADGTDSTSRAAELAGASASLQGSLDEDRLTDAVAGLLRGDDEPSGHTGKRRRSR
ncbi:MAG TPA: response regulator [Candidatus Limnocylindrales bacterium]|nr:response regulator [Candidatus Limnocylindrales bacterium]